MWNFILDLLYCDAYIISYHYTNFESVRENFPSSLSPPPFFFLFSFPPPSPLSSYVTCIKYKLASLASISLIQPPPELVICPFFGRSLTQVRENGGPYTFLLVLLLERTDLFGYFRGPYKRSVRVGA